MDVVAVIGAGRNSGKTKAVEELVAELKRRGLRVGTIKQIHEHGFTIDRKGKDSWRHAESGADIVVAAAPEEVAAIKRIQPGTRFREAMRLLETQELDIVVVEGHPGVRVPMIYAVRDKIGGKPIDEAVLCLVSLTPESISEAPLPVYHVSREIKVIADLLLDAVRRERGGHARKKKE